MVIWQPFSPVEVITTWILHHRMLFRRETLHLLKYFKTHSGDSKLANKKNTRQVKAACLKWVFESIRRGTRCGLSCWLITCHWVNKGANQRFLPSLHGRSWEGRQHGLPLPVCLGDLQTSRMRLQCLYWWVNIQGKITVFMIRGKIFFSDNYKG